MIIHRWWNSSVFRELENYLLGCVWINMNIVLGVLWSNQPIIYWKLLSDGINSAVLLRMLEINWALEVHVQFWWLLLRLRNYVACLRILLLMRCHVRVIESKVVLHRNWTTVPKYWIILVIRNNLLISSTNRLLVSYWISARALLVIQNQLIDPIEQRLLLFFDFHVLIHMINTEARALILDL